MRKITFISLLACSLLVITSCGTKEKPAKVENKTTFEPIELTIPEELRDNPRAVEYLQNLNQAIDAYAIALDKVMSKFQEVGIKEGKEPTTMQKIKLMQIMASHYEELANSAQPYFELLSEGFEIQEELTDDQIAIFGAAADRLEARMSELEKKYEDYNLSE